MRKVSLALLVCLLPLFAACGGSKPKDLIIGKWEAADEKEKGVSMEYKPDGTLTVSMGPIKMDAKYKFTADEDMEVEMNMPGLKEPIKQKLKVKVSKDEMSTTDEKGKVDKFKRAK
jgi:uncharacterized protein (TIGR03066 family)